MRKLLPIFLFLACCSQLFAQKNTFVRIYDADGNKIEKGRVVTTTETALFLRYRKDTVEIAVENIALIRTKRSAGHNILMGTLTVGGTAVIAGVALIATASPCGMICAGEIVAGILFVTGPPFGAALGALTIPFKRSKKFEIGKDGNEWQRFRAQVARHEGVAAP